MWSTFLFFQYYPEMYKFFKIFDNLWLYLITLKSESNNIDGKKMQTSFWKSPDQENFVGYWFKNQTCESRLTTDCHKWIKSSKTTFNSSCYSDVSERYSRSDVTNLFFLQSLWSVWVYSYPSGFNNGAIYQSTLWITGSLNSFIAFHCVPLQ